MVALLGPSDEHLALIEKAFKADIHVRGNQVTLRGDSAEVALAERLLDELSTMIRTGQGITPETVERAIGMLRMATHEHPADVLSMNILSNRGRTIRPKTLNQKRYVDSIDKHTIVFGIGPAGTGKTYLAMAKAVQALQSKNVNRIILTRPAVEAGERLGFLPGTLSDKIDPYLRPLYDALHDMLDPDTIPKLLAAGTIEVAPLAYMRGRAQPYDSQVLTPDGFRDFGSLEVGDLVVGSDGLPTPVIGIYPQGRKQVYRVTTQDGASTLACGEHLWTVRTPEDKRRNTQPGARDSRDDRQAPARAHPALRATRGGRRRVRAAAGPDGSLRPRAAARGRLPHHLDDAELHHGRPPAGRGAAGPPPGDRAPPQGRHQLRPQARRRWRARRRHHGEPGHRDPAEAGPRGHPVVDEVRPPAVPPQLGDDAPGPAPGPPRHRRRAGAPAGPHLPGAVLNDVAAAARRRGLPGPLAGWRRLLADPSGGGAGARSRQRSSRALPPRRVRRRHSPAGRASALPAHPQARRLRRGGRRTPDALHREHRAGRRAGDHVHPGGRR